jgi:hypothetical protein
MKTIQKLQKRGRRDLKNGSFMAFSMPDLLKLAAIFFLPGFVTLFNWISLILKTKSREARHQLMFLL